MRALWTLAASSFFLACGSAGGVQTRLGADAGDQGDAQTGGGADSGTAAACPSDMTGDPLVLAIGAHVASAQDETLCLRWTAPEDIDVSGFVGKLGQGGHHVLLLMYPNPPAPDGLAPCSEKELMDSRSAGGFQMLAGASYETDGMHYDFPAVPVQIGFSVPKGAQLVFDAHFLNAGTSTFDSCASMSLDRGRPVIARLEFRTVLPTAEYSLTVPAHGHADVAYDEPAGGAYRIAAASSHMHYGGTHFKMSIKETGELIYESTQWSSPTPSAFSAKRIVIQPSQSFHIECSFDNANATDQHFPDQMCVGGMYLLACALPGAC
jgi:hypothetical protein